MKRNLVSVCALILVLGMLGCSTTSQYVVTPVASELIPTPIGSGSQRHNTVKVEFVSPGFSGELDSLPTCNVWVENGGESALPFSNDMVTVFSGESPVRLYEAMELAEKIAEAEKEKTNEYNAHQNEVFLGTQSTSSDPSATIARMRAADRTNQFAGKKNTYDAQKKAISMMIMPDFVQPGESASGYIVLHAEDIVPEASLSIIISLDGEDFEFVFKVSKT